MAINWEKFILARAKEADKAYREAYAYNAARDPRKAAEQYARQYGVDAALQNYKKYANQALKTQKLLENLESNIGKRVVGMGLSEPERQRMYAAERTPLTQQYTKLMAGAQTALTGYEQARQRWQDMMEQWNARREASVARRMSNYERITKSLPLWREAYALQQQRLIQEAAKRAATVSRRNYYAGKTKTTSKAKKTKKATKGPFAGLGNALFRIATVGWQPKSW